MEWRSNRVVACQAVCPEAPDHVGRASVETGRFSRRAGFGWNCTWSVGGRFSNSLAVGLPKLILNTAFPVDVQEQNCKRKSLCRHAMIGKPSSHVFSWIDDPRRPIER